MRLPPRLAHALRTLFTQCGGWISDHRVGVRSMIWFGMCALAFGISARLTWRIAHVYQVLDPLASTGTITTDSQGWYAFTVLAPPEKKGRATLDFDYATDNTRAVLSFTLPKGTETLAIWRMGSSWGCHYMGDDAGSKTGKPLPQESGDNQYTLVNVSGVALDDAHSVDCDVEPHWMRETFSSTVSAFQNAKAAIKSKQGSELAPIPIDLRINNRPGGFEVIFSPGEFSESKILIEPSHYVVVRFRSIRDEERRDVYLVLIGVFVATGSALLIESARPFIEKIG